MKMYWQRFSSFKIVQKILNKTNEYKKINLQYRLPSVISKQLLNLI